MALLQNGQSQYYIFLEHIQEYAASCALKLCQLVWWLSVHCVQFVLVPKINKGHLLFADLFEVFNWANLWWLYANIEGMRPQKKLNLPVLPCVYI